MSPRSSRPQPASVCRLVGVPTASHLGSTIDEYVHTNTSVEAAASLRDFADRPLIVLTAATGSTADWSANQEALATLSTNSVHRLIKDTDHPGMITDETGTAATTRAIHDVISSIRTAGRLAK